MRGKSQLKFNNHSALIWIYEDPLATARATGARVLAEVYERHAMVGFPRASRTILKPSRHDILISSYTIPEAISAFPLSVDRNERMPLPIAFQKLIIFVDKVNM